MHFLKNLMLFAALVIANPLTADGYEIDLKIDGLAETQVFFAYHYGNKQFIRDSIVLDNKGAGTFRGEKDLKDGLYLVILPNNKYFEFIGNEQKFKLQTDTSDLIGSMKVSGSKENKMMYADLQYLTGQQKNVNRLDSLLALETWSKIERAKFHEDRARINDEIVSYRNDWTSNNSEFFYTKLVKSSEEISVPNPESEMNAADLDKFRFEYYREHFFDNIDFSTNGLVRSPALYDHYETYLNKLTVSHPDSLNKSCDTIIELAEEDDDIYKYTLSYLLNKYSAAKYMGHDAVFVYLADEYYSKGKAHWVDSTTLYRITKGADDLRVCLIGEKGKNIALEDRNGEVQNLYNLEADYKVLFFWDPDCGHCKKMAPKLVAIVPELKEKYNAIVYGVATEHEEDKWLAYLDENNPPWINVADFQFKNNFRKWYNISGTPRIFILDQDHTIIAKKIGADQVLGFMEHYAKNTVREEVKSNAKEK